MRLWMLPLLCGLALTAQAQEPQRPRVALLPLDLPVARLGGNQKELDDVWLGLVSRQSVELANPDAVRVEFQRKFRGDCPENELSECLVWMADHTSSGYALRVELRKLSPREWELTATLAARSRAEVAQPVARRFTFLESPEMSLKSAVKRELEAYSEQLGLEALPLNPGAAAPAVDAPLTAVPSASLEVPPPPPELKSPPLETWSSPAPKARSSWRWAFLTLGTSAAAAGAGAFFGASTLATAAQASSGSPAQYAATLQKAQAQAGGANAAFVIAGVFAAAGLLLLAWDI